MTFFGSCQYTVTMVDVHHEGEIFDFPPAGRNIACLYIVPCKVQSDALQHNKVAEHTDISTATNNKGTQTHAQTERKTHMHTHTHTHK